MHHPFIYSSFATAMGAMLLLRLHQNCGKLHHTSGSLCEVNNELQHGVEPQHATSLAAN